MRKVVRALLSISLLLVLHGIFLFFKRSLELPLWIHKDDDSTILTSKPKPSNTQLAETNNSVTLCQYNGCLRGRWIPRQPQFSSLENFQEVTRSYWNRCSVPKPFSGEISPEEIAELEAKRLVDIVNWTWKPHKGVHVPWDPEDFVVRLLKTPSGIIFMGDSITQGHDHAFGTILEQGGIEFDTDPPQRAIQIANHGLRQHLLKPTHPMTLKLLKRAGVPESRLKYPIFTIIEEHMLIHEKDIRIITGQHGATKDFPWYLDGMNRVEGWEDYLEQFARHRPEESETVTQDTILVLNTGAHWSRGTLYMLPNGGSVHEEQNRLTLVYREMVKMVIERISSVPRLNVYYRATNPAHPQCAIKTKPYSGPAEAYEQEQNVRNRLIADSPDDNDRRVKSRWDWDLFNDHNYVWKKEIEVLERHRKALQMVQSDRPLGVKWLYLDFWEMSLQRPDAHSEPGRDCLHWCLPAVYAEWTHHLYHTLYLEMEQTT